MSSAETDLNRGPSVIPRALSGFVRALIKYAPRWPGKLRTLRVLRPFLVAEVTPGTWIHVDPADRIEVSFFTRERMCDREEIEFLWAVLQAEMTVVDVGAFVGIMSLVAADRVGGAGRVLAFEAGAQQVYRLRQNRNLNMAANITICQLAIGDRHGLVEYNCCETSLDQSSVGYCQTDEISDAITVPMATLDGCLSELDVSHVDMVKIDVEGAELSVLAGAQSLLSRVDAPVLLIEVNVAALEWAGVSASALVDKMRSLGYELYVIEVAVSRAYANVVGVKAHHKNKWPELLEYLRFPLLTHEWYLSRVVSGH